MLSTKEWLFNLAETLSPNICSPVYSQQKNTNVSLT